jgi:nucleoside 2-deoxyribosyltransferase
MKPTLYLAGPMSGLTWRQALEWRKQATDVLHTQWRIINPVRHQVPTERLDEIIPCSTQHNNKHVALHLTATGIASQDEFYIDQSDWIFCNFLDAVKPTFGSVWELGYAWGRRKHILSVIEPGSMHDHPFIRRRSHVFTPSLEDAIQYFVTIAV